MKTKQSHLLLTLDIYKYISIHPKHINNRRYDKERHNVTRFAYFLSCHQVAPAELEDVLLSHPAVADAGVVGVPDDEGGEVPLACVVCKPGMEVTPEEIYTFVAGP